MRWLLGIFLMTGQLFGRPATEKAALWPGSPVQDLSTKSESRVLPEDLPLSWERYYHFVNRAARAVYKNDFFAASAEYDSAFLYKLIPDYIDLKNYITVNSKCCLPDKNNGPIRTLMVVKKVDSTLLFADLPKRIFSSYNLYFINQLQQKFYREKPVENNLQSTCRQLVRQYDLALNTEFTVGQSAKGYQKRDSLLRENVALFLHLYNNGGFPTEEKLGIFYAKNETWAEKMDLVFQQLLRSDESAMIRTIFHYQLQKGHLPPSRYASLMDYVNANSKKPEKDLNFMNTTVMLVNSDAYRPFVYYSDSLMQLVNTNRLSIGLDSFQVVQK
ncbi:MAG: hypothetical protein ABIO24_11755, partial [Saprospiraceae bacterium]